MQKKIAFKDIKVGWKLYRSILGKYRYTSLELAVRSLCEPCAKPFLKVRLLCSRGTGSGLAWGNFLAKYRRSPALMIYQRAKFRFSNPVRVGSSENKKEHSHILWHRQTIVDS